MTRLLGLGQEEKNLIYRSNFYLPDDKWRKWIFQDSKWFRQDGYHHVRTGYAGYGLSPLEITMANFRIHFDAEFVTSYNETDQYGVIFRRNDRNNDYLWYYFFISRAGYYTLGFHFLADWKTIIDNRFSEFIKRGDATNSLMVEMVGQKITLGVNGHILDTVMDNKIAKGYFAIYVTGERTDSYVEARFRNFRLYSLE